ncbi:Trafficking protein particle complex subunit 12 [Frankliniella fusca]|uniref:Trafficking protein particle complex subunit 12 n=1 Tax=Frankliniella fusca TaxID=407009 RepID=A0AAE1L8W4_9NEOP|nr:Trafficking protein particle complex subunit 12 [Frankliniella fusca]
MVGAFAEEEQVINFAGKTRVTNFHFYSRCFAFHFELKRCLHQPCLLSVKRGNHPSRNMSSNQPPSLNQYFSQDTAPTVPGATFFDQISSPSSGAPVDSAMMKSVRETDPSQDLFSSNIVKPVQQSPSNTVFSGTSQPPASSLHEANSTGKGEPVVCRIFSEPETSTSNITSGKNFFDLISSPPSGPTAGIAIDLSLPPSSSSSLLTSPEFTSTGTEDGFTSSLAATPTATHDILDDSFVKSAGFRPNEADRRRDAWIPSEKTRQALIAMATSAPGTYIPDKDMLTMPGVCIQEDMVDPVTDMVQQYLGSEEASKRKVLTMQDVTQDERGLRELIQAGCFRAAVNLTGRLLTIYGQGVGRCGKPSKHTTHSIQLWFTRIALLVKLKQFSLAETEAERFWDFDRPDLYFPFYPDLYGGRMGTLIPFNFRLLLAELPSHNGKPREALNRLHAVLATVRKILKNLESGLSEDGSPAELNAADATESKRLWCNREIRTLHSIVNCSVSCKNFSLALEVLEQVLQKSNELPIHHRRSLLSALGRLHLQLGDVVGAEQYFVNAVNLRKQCSAAADGKNALSSNVPDLREFIDRGLLAVSQNAFHEALESFQKAADIDPANIMVLNNMAVCHLYLGRLREALSILENALTSNPTQGLHEALLLNMSTLIEFESSHCNQKKLGLLKMLARYKGDGVSVGCLKLQ